MLLAPDVNHVLCFYLSGFAKKYVGGDFVESLSKNESR